MIKLVNDTIDNKDIDSLIQWLKTYPRLTKGELTKQFEEKWSKWVGRKYSVYLNSGSSANLAMAYSLLQTNRLKNKKIVFPDVSWITTVSPFIQLGFEPIVCNIDRDTLGIDIEDLERILIKSKPSVLIIVQILGIPNKMREILELCEKYDVILLEDSCESVGSTYGGKMTGQFGLMSSFSLYFGHHFSTVEGGFVSTDDYEIFNILKSIRAHGWDRDLDNEFKENLRKKYDVNEFKSLYTFYYPGFNLRSTDLQAFIGIEQLNKLDFIVQTRSENFLLYDTLIKNDYWKIKPTEESFVSNFAYPVIHPNINKMVEVLKENEIETRPLVCGAITEQPFWRDLYGKSDMGFSKIVDKYGIYLPNNHQMKDGDIEFICEKINSVL